MKYFLKVERRSTKHNKNYTISLWKLSIIVLTLNKNSQTLLSL